MKPILICAALVATLAVPTVAEEAVDVSVAGLTATFTTLEFTDAFELRVAAPGGQVYTQTFDGAEHPTFTAVDPFGETMAEGSYTWELVALPAPARRSDDAPTLERWVRSGAFQLRDGALVLVGVEAPTRDQLILDDLIVDGSLCVGLSCVNGEAFGTDTIRLKETTVRINFQDTSAGTFPSNDWSLIANDNGVNKFTIDDVDSGRTPFTLEAGAPENALYVDDAGRVGFGTATPTTEHHIVTGDTPTFRLQQDGSSSFTPQTWDIAGNETSFFVRDVTHGSAMPLRIEPEAGANALYLAEDGLVGLGTSDPLSKLHVRGANAPALRIENTTATAGTDAWEFKVNGVGSFAIDDVGDGAELIVTNDAQFRIVSQDSAPSTCTEGALYVDSTGSGSLCFCTGDAWSAVFLGAGGNCS